MKLNTFKGYALDPVHPRKEQIDIQDIAHALRFIPRANGHFPIFYSVAQHCIACCEEAIARGYDRNIILGCLLHDATEAYIGDVIRPVKMHLPKYTSIEQHLADVIYEHFNLVLSIEDHQIIKEIDDSMLYLEFKHFTGLTLEINASKILHKVDLKHHSFDSVMEQYLKLFHQYV